MTEKQIEEGIEIIIDSLEVNDEPITGVVEHIIKYLYVNIVDVVDSVDEIKQYEGRVYG